MRKSYKLYEIKLINGIMMFEYIGSTMAMNIVEAEFMFAAHMKQGMEYQITIPA